MADEGAAGSSSSSTPWRWASSSLSEEGMCDVFLNFRGEDTRFAFTDYLYYALSEIGKLKVFRDDPGLELGDEIKSTLMEAIKRSRIHIVVMSEKYVCSSWCLLELEQMLKYSDDGNKRYETQVIGEIAEQVFAKHRKIKQLLDKFDSEFEAVEPLLNLESCDTVRMVGIYEDPKIGKSYITTFAFELYYKIKYKFRAASFLVDELQHKRVLLVLEGVNSDKHLEFLVGMGIGHWFGLGSRIIITTENKDLFQNHPVMDGVELKTHCFGEGEFSGRNRIVKERNVVKDFIDVINQLREENSMRSNVVSIVSEIFTVIWQLFPKIIEKRCFLKPSSFFDAIHSYTRK
ncbi:disease resistance protein Roq1-like [Arachis duranensis]|uniref:Disease resistance protein Roq1-like n=1 Tax=Arachis duranensis TaxID=130453 RepID=A0A6P4D7T2_ARADU|nr:disease resistance protein Roq1-like [Arachis duranensis]